MAINMRPTIQWRPFSDKHRNYILNGVDSRMSVAEGAIRSGKTIDNCIIACAYLEVCKDKYHLASGSTVGNAKLNIGACNGFGLEYLFRGRCKWTKHLDNEALKIQTQAGEKIVIFVGAAKADSYKKILGNSYGLWIATEINLHYDANESETSFIKVAFGRQLAAVEPKILWDLNPSNPKHKIYSDYIDLYLNNNYAGGYNYQHFVIRDNLSVDKEELEKRLSQYVKGSIWYRRDIEGERVIAEGLCYEQFANNKNNYIVENDYLEKEKILKISVGIDFGGNLSATTFVATAITLGMRELIAIRAKRIKKNISAVELENEFIDFCEDVYSDFGGMFYCEADSAESILINSLNVALTRRFGKTKVRNALKGPILERIKALNKLIAQNRFKVLKSCTEVISALERSSWNPKVPDERLDIVGFENPIDIMDSLEYSFEKDMYTLIKII